jgi:hypothetical protein
MLPGVAYIHVLTLALFGSGQPHTPPILSLPPGKIASGTHWIGGWVGHRAGLDDEKRENS